MKYAGILENDFVNGQGVCVSFWCQGCPLHCPACGSNNIQQLRRVTGYLTGNYKTAFNKGKQQKNKMRVKHGKGNI